MHSHGSHKHTHTNLYLQETGQKAQRVTLFGIWINVLLGLMKGVIGVLSSSTALIADAMHTVSDVVSDLVTLFSVRMSRKPRDSNHPYGHGRFETVGTFLVAFILAFTGYEMIRHSLLELEQVVIPTQWALYASIISIVVKEGLYRITIKEGRRQNSPLLVANAWHHRTDALSSVAAMVGIVLAQLGYPMADPLAAVVVSVLIIKTALEIGYTSIKELTDYSVDESLLKRIEEALMEVEEVIHFHDLRARRMGPYVVVDLHIQVAQHLSVSAGHQVGERVMHIILTNIPEINEVLVHVDAEDDEVHTSRLLRPQQEVEQDIREALGRFERIQQVSHIVCHYLQNRLLVKITIEVPINLTVSEVQELAKQARKRVEAIEGVDDADLHLELDDEY